MASFENLEWTLIAEDKASGTFQKVSLAAKQLSDSTKEATKAAQASSGAATTSGSSWSTMAKGVFAGVAAFEAAKSAFSFLADGLRDSVNEAMQAQSEIARLTTLTQNATGASREQVQALLDQADALELVGVVSGGAITTAQGQLATFDLTTEAIGKLTPALLDMAVAEYGVRVSADQLRSTANGLGKALQGQTDLLAKMGFQFDDTTRKILENGTEQERVTAITEILNSTYEDMNEIMAQTAEGRLVRLENAFSKVKETIGMALLPTLSLLTDAIIDETGKVKVNEERLANWQLRIYQASVIIGGIIGTIANFGKSLYLLGVVVVKFEETWLKAIAGAITSLIRFKDVAKNVFTAVKQAITGDIDGALSTLKSTLTSNFSLAIASFDGLKSAAGDLWGQMQSNFAPMDAAIDKAMNHTAFDEMVNSMKIAEQAAGAFSGGFENGMDGAGEAAAKAKDDVKKALDGLNEDYVDSRGKIAGELLKLEQSHSENIEKIQAKLADLSKSLAQTTADYQTSMSEINQTEAERVVEQEQTIADLTKQIADIRAGADSGSGVSANDQSQIAMLEDRLKKEQAAYEVYIKEREGLEVELGEARRRASLTDFERFVEDINAKRAEEQTAYNARIGEIQQQVVEQQNALALEQAVYEAKKAMYAEVDAAFQAFHDQYLNNLTDMGDYTKETVGVMEAELTRIIDLFAEIQSLRADAGLANVSLGSAGGEAGAGATTQDNSLTQQVTNNITITVQAGESSAATAVAELKRQLELAGLAST